MTSCELRVSQIGPGAVWWKIPTPQEARITATGTCRGQKTVTREAERCLFAYVIKP